MRQTHAALIAAASGGIAFDHLTADESIPSYLPMAWVGDNLFPIRSGWWPASRSIVPNRATRDDGPPRDRPDLFRAAACLREPLTQVIRMEDASALARAIFHHFTAWRAGAARRSSTATRYRPAIASTTGSATSSCTDRCATCWG